MLATEREEVLAVEGRAADPDEHELRRYRIVDGVVTEEPVQIVEQYEKGPLT